MDSGLAINKPMTLSDGKEDDLTIAEEENRRTIKFDETEQSFSTKN